MTLAEYVSHVTLEPILNEQKCNDLREVLNQGSPSVSKLDYIFELSTLIDFENTNPIIIKILVDESLNYLFQDSTTSEQNEQVDWIELATGDRFLKYMNKYAIPLHIRNTILLAIEATAQNNLSVLLAEAITNSK